MSLGGIKVPISCMSIGGKTAVKELKYEVNLPGNLFLYTKRFGLVYSDTFCTTQHSTVHHKVFAWLNCDLI